MRCCDVAHSGEAREARVRSKDCRGGWGAQVAGRETHDRGPMKVFIARTLTVAIAVLGLAIFVLGVIPAASSATVWPTDRAYYRGKCGDDSAQRNGARAYLEVNNGSVSAADITGEWYNGKWYSGFIDETIWVAQNPSYSWVEIGYGRGWEGFNILYSYWACYTVNGMYYEHLVTNIDIAPGDNPRFSIEKNPNQNNAWDCFIDDVPARDNDNDYTANSSIGNYFTKYWIGLESNCTSGEIGSSSDRIDITSMRKTADSGYHWTPGPAVTYQTLDPAGYSHGWWVNDHEGDSLWNWRNH
jgi:hypothetical protein